MLRAHEATVTTKTIPRWAAYSAARLVDAVWRRAGIKRWQQPLSAIAIQLMGQEVTVVDAKARREFGYRNIVEHDAGLEQMRRLHAAEAQGGAAAAAALAVQLAHEAAVGAAPSAAGSAPSP